MCVRERETGCKSVYVCVCVRERETEREEEKESERETGCERVCVCVREREREERERKERERERGERERRERETEFVIIFFNSLYTYIYTLLHVFCLQEELIFLMSYLNHKALLRTFQFYCRTYTRLVNNVMSEGE